jgi:hypothetical protein
MRKYRINKEIFEAVGPTDLVGQMRQSSFTIEASPAAFMVATAARVAEQFGTEVRSDTADHFVADLIKVGVVEEVT